MMLSIPDIQAIREVCSRALKAGLIEFKEMAHLGRVAIALEIEERILLERMTKTTNPTPTEDPPGALEGSNKES